jgi:tRNA 2-thiouridine synthesizing protein A
MTDDEGLLRGLERHADAACAACGGRLCGHLVLFSIALGLKDSPRCLACLATGLSRSADELGEQLTDYIQRRECYRNAWEVANRREGVEPNKYPPCVWPQGGPKGIRQTQERAKPQAADGPVTVAASWDAGHMGCGDLVLALRGRLLALPPGDVLKVTALDPAAPEDLPAWCRLTGHRLLRAEHPDYYIQRKET